VAAGRGRAGSRRAGVLSRKPRGEELEVLLALWAELCEQAPEGVQRDLKALWRHLQLALPHLVVFADGLEQAQQVASEQLGAAAVSLIGWAWQCIGSSRLACSLCWRSGTTIGSLHGVYIKARVLCNAVASLPSRAIG